jgi:signal transduction histidine kinase
MITPPIPKNEMERLLSLAELDIDFTNINENFKDLTKLAAKIAGTEISQINLIDSYTQWTIAYQGLEGVQTSREETVCQYTLMEEEILEIKDLKKDIRFKDKPFVGLPLLLRYYMGLPLKADDGHNIGSLCVIDREEKDVSAEKVEMLKIIAGEIVKRLKFEQTVSDLHKKAALSYADKKKAAHDIRGPLAGIIGISEIIAEQGKETKIEDLLEMISLINKSSKSLLELADEILTNSESKNASIKDDFNLTVFKDKLEKLFSPQARNKNINLTINVDDSTAALSFGKSKLLQITGNLISNAIKFTPNNGEVNVNLALKFIANKGYLDVVVADSGIGITKEKIFELLNGNSASTLGTGGEKGYGFGLSLVCHLVSQMKGNIDISSDPQTGTIFNVSLPI